MTESKARGMSIQPPQHVEIITSDAKLMENKVQSAAINGCTFFLLIQTDNELIHRNI